MKHLLFIFILGFATQAYSEDRIGVDGQVRASQWVVKPEGKPTQDYVRASVRLDGWINVTSDGCLKIRGRVTTGDKFNNEWFNTGIGDVDGDFNISLRHLYIDSKCFSEKVRLEAGAIPVRNYGSLGMTAAGWIDGMRVTIDDSEHKREWVVSAGRVGDAETPNALKRNFDGINHVQVDVKQDLGGGSSGFVSVANYEETFFTRAGLEYAVSKYIEFIQSIGIEALFSDDRFLGAMVSANFKVKKWNHRLFVARLDPKPEEGEKLALLFKNFYGYGTNAYLESTRRFENNLDLNLRIRLGDAGPQGAVGFTKRFSVPKKAVPPVAVTSGSPTKAR